MNTIAASTDAPYIRRLYSLRERFDELLFPIMQPSSQWTRVNSSTACVANWTRQSSSTWTDNTLADIPDLAFSQIQDCTITPFELKPREAQYKELFAVPESLADNAATVSEIVSALTATDALGPVLTRTLDVLLETAKDERFEDGMDSNLSVGLRVLLRNYPSDFVRILDDRLTNPRINARTLAEVLHTLGSIDSAATREWRLGTLVRFLKAPSPLVRDAAATGLAYLDDVRGVPHLRNAIARETSEDFREDLRAIVEQLGG